MTSIEAKLAELAVRFAGRAAEDRAALADAVARNDRGTIRARAHKLAGVAAMFGFPEIGEAALVLELAAERGDPIDDPARWLDTLLADLQARA